MADVTNDEVTVSENKMDLTGRRRNGENREETDNNERVHEQVLRKEDADQKDGDQSAKHFTGWQYAMERGDSPFEYMNRYMEKLERMDENDLQKVLKDREQMRMEWAEAREEGRIDEFWKKWAEDQSSQPRFDYGFGPPPEVIQKWMKLKLKGKSRHEILREMFGDKLRFDEGFNTHDGIYNANLSGFGEIDSRGRNGEFQRERGDGSWRGRGGGHWSERGGRFGSGQDDGEMRFRGGGGFRGHGEESRGDRGEGGWGGRGEENRGGRGEGGRGCRGEGGRGGRGEENRGGRGEGGWRGRGEGGRGGRGAGGWRGGGWYGRGWDMSAYRFDPDRSYLFQQFHV